jgi:dipeptidyl aminopeptidase/acylaminoacyl peptidase
MLVALLPASGMTAPEPAQRTLSPEDVLHFEAFGRASISPDGRLLAVERTRPLMQEARVSVVDLETSAETDVRVSGADAVTLGEWSPDGRFLIVYGSQVNSASASIGVWRARERRYTGLPGGFDQPADTRLALWQDAGRIIYVAAEAPPAGQPLYSVLESGSARPPRTQEENLVRVDLATGAVTHLARGRFLRLDLSPQGHHLAVLDARPAPLPTTATAERRLLTENLHNRLLLIDLSPSQPPLDVSGERDVYYLYSDSRFMSWSPDGDKLAFYAFAAGRGQRTPDPYLYDLDRRRTRRLQAGTLALSFELFNQGIGTRALYWLNDAPVVLAPSGESPEQQLWRLAVADQPRQLSRRIPSIEQLMPAEDKLWAIAAGKLWEFDGEHPPRARDIRQPLAGFAAGEPANPAILPVLVHQQQASVPAYLNLRDNHLIVIEAGGGDVRLLAQARDYLLYRIATFTGNRLMLYETANAHRRTILDINRELGDLELAEVNRLTYGTEDRLHGWVLKPPGYNPARRYPVVVVVYGGLDFSAQSPSLSPWTDPQSLFIVNGQLLAAAGYVVVIPSLPLDAARRPLDIPAQLSRGALAAVEQLIERKIADPQRLAILGHSWGGYGVAAILTQTDRFKTAVAVAGVYNLSSWYGTFVHRDGDVSLEHAPFLLEEGLGRMSVPPWKDPPRYTRNSPLFLANRINTPILFLHGDADSAAPIMQTEEMFTALCRQGKKARFVRYPEVDHSIIDAGPAVFRHAYGELLRWLESTL